MDTKEFIGHGTKHSQYDIIDVVLNMDKAKEYIFEYEGKTYLKFSVASRLSKSKFGATHATYVRQRSPEAMAAAEPPAPKRKATRKGKAAKA